MENIIKTIELFNGAAAFILLFITLPYIRKLSAAARRTWNHKLCCLILSFIQSFIIVTGTIYEINSSYVQIFSKIGTILLTVIGTGALVVLFYRFNSFILSGTIYSVNYRRFPLIEKLFRKIPFVKLSPLKMFLYLSLSRAVYLFIYYPGNIDSDCSATIGAFYRAYTPYSSILGDISISNHIPVIHTFLYGGFMYIGDCIGIQNLGIFLLVLLQTILINGALLLLLQKLYETGYIKITNLLLLFFCLMPIYSLWSVELVKDQLYSGMLLYYVWQLWMICSSEGGIPEELETFTTAHIHCFCDMHDEKPGYIRGGDLWIVCNDKLQKNGRSYNLQLCDCLMRLCISLHRSVVFSLSHKTSG